MTIKNRRTKWIPFLLGIILLLAFFFRFFKFDSWLTFGMDQEYEAFLVKNIVAGKHFPLIGVNASDTGLYLGPAFIYFSAVPFVFFGGNPFGWGITASAIGILVCFIIYRISSIMFSQKVGLFASLIYAASFLTSFYDRKFWNPTPVPLFSLLLGFLLYQILKGKPKNLVVLAFVFALVFHIHLSLLVFIPLILYVIWAKRKTFSKKLILLSLSIFLLIQIPLIFFEFRHNFLNTKAAFNLLLNKNSENVSTLGERSTFFVSTLGRLFWLPANADLSLESGQCKELSSFQKSAYPEGILLILAGLIIFGWWCFKNFSDSAKIVIGIFSITFLFVVFYGREIFEYYFLYLFPWLSIALGKSLSFIWEKEHGKVVVIPIVSLFIILNFSTLLSSSPSYSYKDKIEAINFVKQNIKNQSYVLEALGECTRFEGYRYLFEYYIGGPDKSYMDSYFGWLYPESIKYVVPQRIVLLSLIDPRYENELVEKWEETKLNFLSGYNIIAEKSFNNIKVFILSSKYDAT